MMENQKGVTMSCVGNLTEMVREVMAELAYEPEDLCEKPHPEARPGEVFLGYLNQYRVGGNTPVKDYGTRSAMIPYASRRLGKGRKNKNSLLGGFEWPVFASIVETEGIIHI